MRPLVSVEQFLERVRPGEPFIPLNAEGEPDAARGKAEFPTELALSGATGVIVAHLPWLLDKETGKRSFPRRLPGLSRRSSRTVWTLSVSILRFTG